MIFLKGSFCKEIESFRIFATKINGETSEIYEFGTNRVRATVPILCSNSAVRKLKVQSVFYWLQLIVFTVLKIKIEPKVNFVLFRICFEYNETFSKAFSQFGYCFVGYPRFFKTTFRRRGTDWKSTFM